MDDIKYDEQGGIVNASDDLTAKKSEKKEHHGYNLFEKLLIRHCFKIGYLLDASGKYKCRLEKAPNVIRIGPTNRCTARCFYCPREHIHARGTGYMEWDIYEQIIAWARENKVATIAFALFGEPMLHPRIIEMIALAHEQGLKVRVSSNGIILDRALAEKLLKFPLEAIEISMDGFTAEEFEQGKQVDKHEQARENVLELLGLAKKAGSKASFNIHFVDIGHVGLFNKIRFIRFWKKNLAGLDYQKSFYYEPHNWAGTRDYLRRQMGWLDRLLGKWELKKPCVYVKGLNINWNGDVLICTNDPTDKAIIGNINNNKLEDIYNGKERMEYLEEHETGNFKKFNCGVCTVNIILPLSYIKRRIINTIVSWLS